MVGNRAIHFQTEAKNSNYNSDQITNNNPAQPDSSMIREFFDTQDNIPVLPMITTSGYTDACPLDNSLRPNRDIPQASDTFASTSQTKTCRSEVQIFHGSYSFSHDI